MKILLADNKCIIEREQGDRRFYGVRNAAGESALLYHLKKLLNQQFGLDFIKERIAKDGHVVDDIQQYIRERSLSGRCLAIWNPSWAIEGAEAELNRTGRTVLRIEDLND